MWVVRSFEDRHYAIREGERCVGPFASEASAIAWINKQKGKVKLKKGQ